MIYKENIGRIDGGKIVRTDTLTSLDIQAVTQIYKPLRQIPYNVKARCECSLSGTITGLENPYYGGQMCDILAKSNVNRKFDGWYCEGKKLSSIGGIFGCFITEDKEFIAKFKTTDGYYYLKSTVSSHYVPALRRYEEDGTITVNGIQAPKIAIQEGRTYTLVAKKI